MPPTPIGEKLSGYTALARSVTRPIGLLTRIGRTLPLVADDFMQRIVAESKTWP